MIPRDNEQLKFCGLLWVRCVHSSKIHVKIIRKARTVCGIGGYHPDVINAPTQFENVNPTSADELCSTCYEFMKKRFGQL